MGEIRPIFLNQIDKSYYLPIPQCFKRIRLKIHSTPMLEYTVYQQSPYNTHLFCCVPVLGFEGITGLLQHSSAWIIPFIDLGFYSDYMVKVLKSPGREDGDGFLCYALTSVFLTEPIADLHRSIANIMLGLQANPADDGIIIRPANCVIVDDGRGRGRGSSNGGDPFRSILDAIWVRKCATHPSRYFWIVRLAREAPGVAFTKRPDERFAKS